MRISYCISVCNEHIELASLLSTLSEQIDIKVDEVCILGDEEKITTEVINVINKYSKIFNHFNFLRFPLNNDFASFKNKFFDLVNGDYIFQLDADEIPSVDLIQSLKSILILNESIETYLIPRENIVEGITQEHIQKWGWIVDNYDRINYPDYQMRIFKNNGEIKWQNKVHEILIGYKSITELPEEYCLYHYKTIEKQEKQNKLYENISYNNSQK
jgi:hypothetical protein